MGKSLMKTQDTLNLKYSGNSLQISVLRRPEQWYFEAGALWIETQAGVPEARWPLAILLDGKIG